MKEKCLVVRNVTWVFNPEPCLDHSCVDIACSCNMFAQETVYGKRDGCVHGLAITADSGRNYFHASKAWKSGCVMNIPMLQRNEMTKPEAGPVLCKWSTFDYFSFIVSFILG